MCSPGQVHRHAVLDRGGRGRAGATDGAQRALDEGRRPGKANAAQLGRFERAVEKTIDILGGVHEEEGVSRRALRLSERVGGRRFPR